MKGNLGVNLPAVAVWTKGRPPGSQPPSGASSSPKVSNSNSKDGASTLDAEEVVLFMGIIDILQVSQPIICIARS